ncbi:hypothetical protein OAE29_05620 [Octadecabacter sp.]|nr:hypothetical protein [Octadecabacter sp.]
MWARIENNNIVEYYDRKQSLLLNDVRYSSQIFTIWTDAQRKELGIVPVVISGSHLDTKYYIEHNHSDAIAGDGNSVIRTIGVKAADRALEDVDAVDEDGNALLDDYGVQMVTRGLKYNAIQKVKDQQAGYLSRTDWYIIRKADAGTAIPTAIQTFRNAIRADATRIENAITAATTMDEFIALHTTTYNEDRTVDQIATVQSWTEE